MDTIELDVLWARDGHPKLPAAERTPLIVAHDWHDAEHREPATLTEVLDAFLERPLDKVEIDLDIKLPGREEEIVEALRERDLVGRAMTSTMELSTIRRLGELEPSLRRGWTYPKVTRDWLARRWLWARPALMATMIAMRRRLPRIAARDLPKLGVRSMWVFHPLISSDLAQATKHASVELIAWTVDDIARMRKLAAMGVDGICSNDPRLFAQLEG